MGLNRNSNFSDTFESAVQGVVTVGTSAVELKIGVSPLANRQMIRVVNESSTTIYIGPSSGVTTTGSTRGEKLEKNQEINIMLTENQSLYAIAGSAGNEIIVWEFA